MSTIVVKTFTGSTYTLRHAADVKGAPTTLRHDRGAYCPPEVLFGGGRVVNCPASFHFDRTLGEVVLVVPGVIAHTSPIVSLTVDGIDIPVGVTRMGG